MHKLYSLKKAKQILIATNNPGKFIELKEILPKNIKYYKPNDFNFALPEVLFAALAAFASSKVFSYAAASDISEL